MSGYIKNIFFKTHKSITTIENQYFTIILSFKSIETNKI